MVHSECMNSLPLFLSARRPNKAHRFVRTERESLCRQFGFENHAHGKSVLSEMEWIFNCNTWCTDKVDSYEVDLG